MNIDSYSDSDIESINRLICNWGFSTDNYRLTRIKGSMFLREGESTYGYRSVLSNLMGTNIWDRISESLRTGSNLTVGNVSLIVFLLELPLEELPLYLNMDKH